MKTMKLFTILALLITFLTNAQIIEHTNKVELKDVDELTPPISTTKVLTTDPTTGEIKYVEANDLPAAPTSSFKDVLTGLPNTSTTTEIYREEKIGLNEPNPEELLDMVGTSLTGAFKSQYTYDNGMIVRSQFGGENILSEVGVPSGNLSGYITDINNILNYPNTRSYVYGGDFTSVQGGVNLQTGIGISPLIGMDFITRINFEPITEDSTDDWKTRIQTYNLNGDYAELSIGTKGAGTNFLEESQARLNIYNSEGDNSTLSISPHLFTYNNFLNLAGYGDGVFVVGYTHTDDIAKTGTAATVLGEVKSLLGVDTFGNVVESPVLYQKTITTTPSEIQSAFSSPIILIPAQGADTFISIQRAYINYENSTQVYDTGGTTYLTFSDIANAQMRSGTTLTQIGTYLDMYYEESGRNALFENTPLYLMVVQDGTTGDADITIYIEYTIFKTN